ncbi:von Willebrand factor A domain-containing protein 2 isoform X2 [Gadus morhua]|uniref:von Willebrand factor A domain-containing protein 2 isoform X2 n=1 Tax=Gadus morhua TaxID=8049 RepID=UPI0011B818B6|nr:von Willebrand factor A domain-containing protein 2 isoform X2 [Gadus morhua]
MHLGTVFTLLPVMLLLKAHPGCSLQEIQTTRETLSKINAAGEMMECSAPMDVVFLLDGSYSVGKGSFERSRHYALRLSRVMDIGPDKVRVGVVQFGSSPRLEISLDDCSTTEELTKRLKKITYRGGGTQTAQAFQYLLRKGFPGGRNSSVVSRVAVLLSDGRSQEGFSKGGLVQAASQLKESGVVLFAVGLRHPRWEELHKLASAPMESHVFFAEHFSDAVNGLCTTLTSSSVCDATPTGCQERSYPCERKTLEKVKELHGNFMCWKGGMGASTYTSLCPHYKYTKAYTRHQTVCHRTICPDPCDSEPCMNGGTCVSEGPEGYRCVCTPGYGGDPHCAPALSLDCSVDLLFLVEGSAMLGMEGFLRLKAFLKRFLQTVMASDTPTKVGLAVFGREVRVEAQVGRFRGDVRGLLAAVDGMQPVGGPTRAGQALRHVTGHGFLSAPVFADVTDDLPRVVVLLTATASADEVLEPARYARDRETFLIGVGPERLRGQLDNVTGNPQRTLTYSGAGGLNAKIPELTAKICSVDNQGCLGRALDLVLVVDASAGVGRDNFATLKEFVRGVTVQFDVNRDLAQVALVTYGRRAGTEFPLDAHASGSAVLAAVGEARYAGGAASLGAALLHLRAEVLTAGGGARPGVHRAAVVLTDGAGGEDAAVPAQRLRDDGVAVFVVGVGDMQRERLLRVAGAEERVMAVPFYEDLKYFEDVLVQMLCAELKKPMDPCKPNPCMNDGICSLLGGSFRCDCRDFEGPQCETKSRWSRGDQPRPDPQERRTKGDQPRPDPQERRSRGDQPRPDPQERRTKGDQPRPDPQERRTRGDQPRPDPQERRTRGDQPRPDPQERRTKGHQPRPDPQERRTKGDQPRPDPQQRKGRPEGRSHAMLLSHYKLHRRRQAGHKA